MKKVCLDVSGSRALGDTLSVTPTLRKLYHSYNQKISIITHHPHLFSNNPYVDIIHSELTDEVKNECEVFNSFNIGYHPNGVCYKHNSMDIRQFHAINLGFMLTKDEMELDYIVDYETQEIRKATLLFQGCGRVEFLINPGFDTPNSLLNAEEERTLQSRTIKIETNTTAGTIRIECLKVYFRIK
jgi:hypothetical protein